MEPDPQIVTTLSINIACRIAEGDDTRAAALLHGAVGLQTTR